METILKEMLEDEHEILGVQSRVGSFDDEMFNRLDRVFANYKRGIVSDPVDMNEINELLEENEAEEQRIADGHSLDSDFGFNEW